MSSSRWNLFFLVVIYIIAFLLAGLNEWVNAGFDTSTIFTPSWWAGVFQSIALNHMILLGTIFYSLNEMKINDEDILAEEAKLKLFVDTEVKPVTFKPFMVKFNKERKKIRHIRNIDRKLDKLDRHVKVKNLAEWERIHPKDKDVLNTKNKYCRKRMKLEAKLDEDYINKHLTTMHVKGFKVIQKTFVTNGYTSRRNDEDDQQPEAAAVKMFFDLAPKILITISVLVALNSIRVEAMLARDPKEAIIGTIFSIAPMLLQVFIAKGYSKRYKQEKIMVDFRKRKEIGAMYKDDLKGVESNG